MNRTDRSSNIFAPTHGLQPHATEKVAWIVSSPQPASVSCRRTVPIAAIPQLNLRVHCPGPRIFMQFPFREQSCRYSFGSNYSRASLAISVLSLSLFFEVSRRATQSWGFAINRPLLNLLSPSSPKPPSKIVTSITPSCDKEHGPVLHVLVNNYTATETASRELRDPSCPSGRFPPFCF